MPRKSDKPYRAQANLSVLFGDESSSGETINISQIILPSSQPRKYFDPEKLEQLASSIKAHGVIEPLLVRPLGNKYELVAGERRYRACQMAEINDIPVTIKELSDESAFELALVENLQREDLNPVEETEGVLFLLAQKLTMSVESVVNLLYKINNESKKEFNHNVMVNSEIEVIESVFKDLGRGRWQSFVVNRLPLLKLPEDILTVLREGKIAYTKAIALSKIKDDTARQELLKKVIENNLSLSQIKKQVKLCNSNQRDNESPQLRVKEITKSINKAKLWEKEPKKWQKVEKLLAKIEELISP